MLLQQTITTMALHRGVVSCMHRLSQDTHMAVMAPGPPAKMNRRGQATKALELSLRVFWGTDDIQ